MSNPYGYADAYESAGNVAYGSAEEPVGVVVRRGGDVAFAPDERPSGDELLDRLQHATATPSPAGLQPDPAHVAHYRQALAGYADPLVKRAAAYGMLAARLEFAAEQTSPAAVRAQLRRCLALIAAAAELDLPASR